MTYSDIKKSIIEALRDAFPGEKIYGTDIVKGFKRPCIFVSLSPGLTEETVNIKAKTCYVEILRMQPQPDEDDALAFFEKVEGIFSPKVAVGNRRLNSSDFRATFIGEENNVPQIEFEIDYYVNVEKKETSRMIEQVEIKEEL